MNAISSLLVMLFLATVPAAKLPDVAAQIDQGREALRRGEISEAARILDAAVKTARGAGDDVSEARALFFLGLLAQQQAMKVTDGKAAAPLYGVARDHYIQSLEKYPSSTSTLANLAEVHEALGDISAATAVLQRGYALDDSRRGYFAARLAEISASEGNAFEALKFYRAAASTASAPPAVETKIIDTYLASSLPPAGFIAYLWEILPTAPADEVLRGAVGALRRGNVDVPETDALFGIIATTLARQNYSQAQLAELEILQDFSALKHSEPYRERAEALRAMAHAELTRPELFFRWPEKLQDDDLPPNLSPRLALADFSAALGRRSIADKHLDRAESYFELARDLGKQGDLQLAGDLASLYFSQRRLADLQKLTRELDAILYAEGGIAGQKDLAQLYEFHRRLGTFHAMLEPPPIINPTPSAAADQLQKAIRAAQLLSNKRVSEGKPPFEVDESVFRLLTRSLVKQPAAAAAGH